MCLNRSGGIYRESEFMYAGEMKLKNDALCV